MCICLLSVFPSVFYLIVRFGLWSHIQHLLSFLSYYITIILLSGHEKTKIYISFRLCAFSSFSAWSVSLSCH